ncbi:MAG: gliding motility-associated C-terminal domain-containing protein [Saprospiraceae bacterium]|nr:gliding motility-associated C-terminal domain-containing protein [Candidatus Brachybacter algidus]
MKIVLRIFLLLFSILHSNYLFSQPPSNDDCNNSIIVTQLDGTCNTYDFDESTYDFVNGGCADPAGQNIWFLFTAQGPKATFTAAPIVNKPMITVVSIPSGCGNLTGALEMGCAGGSLTLNNLTAGQNYYVIITTFSGIPPEIDLCINNPVPPPNDEPCNAINIATNGCVNGTTLGANADFVIPGCPASNVQNAVFYAYNLGPTTVQLDITVGTNTMTGNIGVALLSFPTGCSNPPTLAANGTFYCGPVTNTFSFDGLTPGSTVYFMIGSTDAGAGNFTDFCITEVIGVPPCNTNIDCANALPVTIPTSATPVCVQGCNNGMPDGPLLSGGGPCSNMDNPTAWFSFNTGPNNTAVFNFSSADLTSPLYAVFNSCNTWLECNPVSIDLTPNTTYYVAVTDANSATGNFELCITLLNITAPCITTQSLTIVGASLGSPLSGPFKKCEEVTFKYTTNFIQLGSQWIHSMMPVISECFEYTQGTQPTPSVPPTGNASWSWYPAGTVYWKPVNNANSAVGINSTTGNICIIGSPGCAAFVGGGNCSNTGTVMPAGWIGPTYSGTCSSSAPNLSYGDNSNGIHSVQFTLKIPCTACSDMTCNDYTVAITSFADGQTGGWTSAACNGHSIVTKKIVVQCCTPPDMILEDGETCSGKTFFANIILDPTNSTLQWEVLNANGVSGATAGTGSTFSTTLINSTGSVKIVTFNVYPVSETGCVGEPQVLSITVFPELIADAGPDFASCPGAILELGGNPTASGGAGAPYTILWSTGEDTPNITVTPTINSTYSVTVTDANGCEDVDDVIVSVSGVLTVSILPNPAVYCLSDLTGKTLSANVNSTNSPFTYKWTTPWGIFDTPTILIGATMAGTSQITLQVTDAYGCQGIGTLNLVINPAPSLMFVNAPTGPLCPLESFQIITIPSYTQGTIYTSNPAGFVITDGNILTDQMTPGVQYWFIATYTDPLTGCISKDSFQTEVILLDDPVITQAGPFCANTNGPIQLIGTPTGGTWIGNVSANGEFYPNSFGAGIYNIDYIIGSGTCTKQTSTTITVNPNPTPILYNLTSYCTNETPNPILVSDIPGGTWSAPLNNFGEVPLNTLAPGIYNFTYTVTVDGCVGSLNDNIIIADQPTASLIQTGVVCNADPGMEGKSKLDLDDFITSGSSTGIWKEIAPLSGAVTFGNNIYDFTGVTNGTIATFSYTLTAALPCADFIDTVSITVDDNCDCPKIQFGQANPLCNNNGLLDLNSLKINAASGDWTLITVPSGSNPATLIGSTFDGTGKDAGTYVMRYTLNPLPTNVICPTYADISITLNPQVVYTLKPEIKVCNNAPNPPSVKTQVNLSDFFVGQSVIGTWNNDDNVGTNISGTTWDFTGVAIGTYKFTFTSSNAIAPCQNLATTVNIIVTENCNCPELTLNVPLTTICSDQLALIDLSTFITSAETGTWNIIKNPSGIVNIPIPGGNFDPTGKATGNYEIKFEINISPPDDCDSVLILNIEIVPELVYALLPDATVCNIDPKSNGANELDFSGNSIWSSASIAGSWTDTDGSGAIQNGNIWNFNGVPTGVYTFTFTPSGAQTPCTNNPQTIEITVVDNCACPDLPVLTPIAAICNNTTSINLVVPSGATGTWTFKSIPAGSNPAVINGNTLEVNGKDSGIYRLRFRYDNISAGCPDTGFVNFTLDEYKYAGIANNTLSYCERTALIIDLMDEINGEDPGGVLTEVGPNTAGSALVGSNLKIKDLSPGDYIFQYKFNNGGACPASSAEVNIKVFENPIADAGISQELTCEKATATIGGSNTSTGPNFTYLWTEKDNKIIPNPTASTLSVSLDGTYYLLVTETKTGCIARDTVVITSDPDRPQGIEIERDGPTCFGYKDGYIKITKIEGGAPPILYSFNDGPYSSINSWINLSGSSNVIRIKDANGCTLVLDDINLIEPPLVTIELGNDTIINIGDTVLIDPEISIPDEDIGTITFSSAFDFINCAGCFEITVFPNQTTEYTVEVKDKNGCSDVDTKKIIVKKGVNIFIPNIFSPNGDGNNDRVIISTNSKEIKKINSFQIYDRWGEKMFEALNFEPNNPAVGWDGNLKGQKCNPAVYVYWAEVELFDGTRQILKGDVTLIR